MTGPPPPNGRRISGRPVLAPGRATAGFQEAGVTDEEPPRCGRGTKSSRHAARKTRVRLDLGARNIGPARLLHPETGRHEPRTEHRSSLGPGGATPPAASRSVSSCRGPIASSARSPRAAAARSTSPPTPACRGASRSRCCTAAWCATATRWRAFARRRRSPRRCATRTSCRCSTSTSPTAACRSW